MLTTLGLVPEIMQRVQAASKVVLVFHKHPDPDSLGAGAAFGGWLTKIGKPYLYYCATELPKEALFFGLETAQVLRHPEELLTQEVDLICTFDAGDARFAGIAELLNPALPARTYVMNFDHHATNTSFGDLNIIDTACASTTELIFNFFKALPFPLTPRLAVYLLAGLLTDTDHFFNPATTPSALRMAAELLESGVTLSTVRALFLEQRSLGALQLTGRVLARLQKNERYGIAFTYLTRQDLSALNLSEDEVEGVSNLLNSLAGARAMLFLRETADGQVKVSWRTTREDVDVGKLAKLCGGGGHQKAAGVTLPGALDFSQGYAILK